MHMHSRNGRSGENLVGNGDNGLSYLVTHAINPPKRGCDRCLPVERCWTEIFLSQMMSLRNDFHCTSSGLGLVFHRQQDSARKMLILRQDTT